MFLFGQTLEGQTSLLEDFAQSAWSAEYVGREGTASTAVIDEYGVRKVLLASRGSALLPPEGMPCEASPAYLWVLVNNTATYRRFEDWLNHRIPAGQGHVHAGDDYFIHAPLKAGDRVEVSYRIEERVERELRSGPAVFIEDRWSFRSADGALAAELVRKVVNIQYVDEPAAADFTISPDTEATVGARPSWSDLVPGAVLPSIDHGVVTSTDVVQWMGAVDDYAAQHHDASYVQAQGMHDARPIIAGPHLGALMLTGLRGLVGAHSVSSFLHVQRRAVHPGEVLRTQLTVLGRDDRETGAEVTFGLTLVDDHQRVRHTARATLQERSA